LIVVCITDITSTAIDSVCDRPTAIWNLLSCNCKFAKLTYSNVFFYLFLRQEDNMEIGCDQGCEWFGHKTEWCYWS